MLPTAMADRNALKVISIKISDKSWLKRPSGVLAIVWQRGRTSRGVTTECEAIAFTTFI